MRILEVITPSRIGGAETYLASTVRQLIENGDEVTIFCPKGRPLVQYLTQQAITPVSWKTCGKFDVRTLYRLVSTIRSQHIDVVHTHLSTASFLGSLAARIAHVPCIATVHGLVHACWYHLPSHIIAVSHAVKAHLVSQGIPSKKITVVHNGIHLSDFNPTVPDEAKKACNLDPTTPLIGVFGRFSSEKGQDISLYAFKLVLEQFPHAKLLLAGEGRQHDYLVDLARQLNIEMNVNFTGFLPDPRMFINACDVVVVPSRTEGLSLSALEAMALQRPVVASRIGGLVEVVLDKESGYLLSPKDPHALAESILHILRHPDIGAQLGRVGRQHVEQHFELVQQVRSVRKILAGDCPPLAVLAGTASTSK